jgi:hypothetical protein
MTEQELNTKLSECYDREDAGNAMAEQARADAEALEAVISTGTTAIVEKAYLKKKR